MIAAELRGDQKPSLNDALAWIGLRIDDVYGAGVGRLEDVWIDPGTGTPRWLLVKEGGFGERTTLIPFEDAAAGPEHVWIPYEGDAVRSAPEVEPGAPLTQQVEAALRSHYARHAAAGAAPAGVSGRPAPQRGANGVPAAQQWATARPTFRAYDPARTPQDAYGQGHQHSSIEAGSPAHPGMPPVPPPAQSVPAGDRRPAPEAPPIRPAPPPPRPAPPQHHGGWQQPYAAAPQPGGPPYQQPPRAPAPPPDPIAGPGAERARDDRRGVGATPVRPVAAVPPPQPVPPGGSQQHGPPAQPSPGPRIRAVAPAQETSPGPAPPTDLRREQPPAAAGADQGPGRQRAAAGSGKPDAIPAIEGLDRPHRVEIELAGEVRISGELRGLRLTPIEDDQG